jgi:hypothetical protein
VAGIFKAVACHLSAANDLLDNLAQGEKALEIAKGLPARQ